MNFRQPPFPPPNPKIIINQIPNQKRPQSSQYRTHFTLMNVYRPPTINEEQFLIKIAQKLKKYITCDIVQISQVIDDDRVDLAIGMQNDRDAMIFLMKNQHIKIQTQRGIEETYIPKVSNVFKTYINAKKHLFPQIIADMSRAQLTIPMFEPPKLAPTVKGKQVSTPSSRHSKSRSSSSSYSSSSRSSSVQNQQKKTNQGDRARNRNNSHERSRSKSKSHQRASKHDDNSFGFNQSIKQTFMVQQIWVFCVPLEYDERDIQARLKQRKIYPISSSWRMSEDMEYLQLRLERSISSQILLNLDMKIGNYSCIVMPRTRTQTELRQEMKKYQSQLISQKPIKQDALLKCLIEIGGVVSISKDDYDDLQRYIITFCSIQKVKKFELRVKEIFGLQITLSLPDEPMRFCRVDKMFAIENMINEYAERFKRTEFA